MTSASLPIITDTTQVLVHLRFLALISPNQGTCMHIHVRQVLERRCKNAFSLAPMRLQLSTPMPSFDCKTSIRIIGYSAFDNYFLQAQRVRQLIKSDFDSVFSVPNAMLSKSSPNPDGVDILLHPSAIRTAPLLDSDAASGLGPYLQDVMTVPASLAGLPALSVPAGSAADGLPVGVSIVGQWGSDELVMCVGKIIQQTADANDSYELLDEMTQILNSLA